MADSICSAKYIEGLENRLGRMEHVLRLSGSHRLPHGNSKLKIALY